MSAAARSRRTWTAAVAVVLVAVAAVLTVLLRGGGGAGAPAARATTPPAPAQAITVLPTDRPVVALTFDAAGDDSGLGALLRTLDDRRAPATFFLTGPWAADHPEAVAAMRAAGSRVGLLGDPARPDEVRAAQDTLLAQGVDPRPLFRSSAADPGATVDGAGYVPVGWTVDTRRAGDTAGVVDRVLGALQPGEIVRMSVGAAPDGSIPDVEALPAVVDALRAAGYELVPVDLPAPPGG